VTWGFLYLTVLLVGLVLAAVTGLVRDLPVIASHRHLVVPRPEQHLSGLNRFGRRLGLALLGFGAAGLLARTTESLTTAAVAAIAGAGALVAAALSLALVRRPCRAGVAADQATVVRGMSPGGYGQVRIGEGEAAAVVAARSADDEELPAGTVVEIVDCTRSVITVRKPNQGPPGP